MASVGLLSGGLAASPVDAQVMMLDGGAPSVKLSDGLVKSLAVGKVYRDHKTMINGMDFTHDGHHLVTSGDDNDVFVYSTMQAQRAKHLHCEKYGVSLIKFLHNDKDCAVAASRSRTDHVLKYWDFQENKYLRLFRAAKSAASSVSPHPYEDLFLSAEEEGSVMLWDLRQERPSAKINGTSRSTASFDQQGLVFAACVGPPRLHLFDTRNYGSGAFMAVDLSAYVREDKDKTVYSVQFSPCGNYLLTRTRKKLLLLDAYEGKLICEYPLTGDVSSNAAVADDSATSEAVSMPSFSPDSQYVISGVPGGNVCIWNTPNARLVQRLEGHSATAGFSAFSPTHALLVTAAEAVAWWIPDPAPS
mmetsp:Transcript_11063/g.25330  ORF Transcript_11063/g.25330 Transcript_11063/m.25330 type:complete len:360 (-) Transcript_11063:30-1109(-)